jgi:carbonic anhydrase/acetyltransferase-like protein (isoleucine patch superfamily)
MTRYALGERQPSIHPTAFIHPDAVIIGDVRIGAEASVWPGAVLRGDRGAIVIGAQTSVQDGAVLHCTAEHDTIVGERCVIGHLAHLEGCTVLDNSLLGSGSVVLAGARIGPVAMVAAAALVPPGREVPTGARAIGVPARIVPDVVTPDDINPMVETYLANTHSYAAELRPID